MYFEIRGDATYSCGVAVAKVIGVIYVNTDDLDEMEEDRLFDMKQHGMTANAFLRYVRPKEHGYKVHSSGGDQWEWRSNATEREFLDSIKDDVKVTDIIYFKVYGNEIPIASLKRNHIRNF